MKTTPAITVVAALLAVSCASQPSSIVQGGGVVGHGAGTGSAKLHGMSTSTSATSSTVAVVSAGSAVTAPARQSPTGTWSGSDNQEHVTIRFGANGSLVLNNASGANAGTWTSSGNGSYRLKIGDSVGDFVMVSPSTATFTVGGSSIELSKR